MNEIARQKAVIAIFLFSTFLISCSHVARLPGGSDAVDDRLYFGRSMHDGAVVGDAEWKEFLRDVVAPAFRDGFTVSSAEGAWRDSTGAVIREGTFVLQIVHRDDPALDAALQSIVDEYRRRFRQESVMWLRSGVEVKF